MRAFRRSMALLLVLVFMLALLPASLAADGESGEEPKSEAEKAALRLYSLGLFTGTGTDSDGNPIFELDRASNRHEAITMLVRLLGKEEEAKSGTWDFPFTDVAGWAKPYVGYAYANKLTSGTSAETFSGTSPVSAAQYITFILRALGYSSETDFKWNRSWELSDALGITDGRYSDSSADFLRGDMAIISSAALDAKLKGEESTLLDALRAAGAVSETESGEKAPIPNGSDPIPAEDAEFLTDGNPVGVRSKVKFDAGSDSFGAVTISGVYSQYLDNGFTRFIVEYSVTATMEIFIFDPPRAALFNLQRESADADVPGRLVFDLKNEDLKQLNSVTVNFYSQRTGNFYLSFYPEPSFLTDGKPVGEIQEVVYTLDTDLPLPSGDMTVSSLTAQGLDNGYTRFTLEYTVPEKLTVSIFNAPSADHFMFFTKSADAGEPGMLIFDLADEDIRAIDYITLKFFNTDTGEHNYVSVKTLQFNIDHSLLLADLSDGQAVGEAIAVTYIPYNYEPESIAWNVSGVTAQKLDNGYMRFTVEYTLSTAMKIDLMADQYELFWVPGFSLYEPGKQQLVFDLNMEDFQTYAYYLLSFTGGVHGETAVFRCGLVFYTDQFG